MKKLKGRGSPCLKSDPLYSENHIVIKYIIAIVLVLFLFLIYRIYMPLPPPFCLYWALEASYMQIKQKQIRAN